MDANALRAIVREELAAALGTQKPKQKARGARILFRCSPAELAAIDAVAAARGVCRSDLMRQCLQPVVPCVMPVKRDIPANFRRRHNHTKPTHYTSPETDDRARKLAAQRSVALGLAARQAAIEAGAATITAAHVAGGMLTDAQGAQSPRKLSRS